MRRLPGGLAVWAVEDTAAQICWDDLPAGEWSLDGPDGEVLLKVDAGPGAVDVTGLAADSPFELAILHDGSFVGVLSGRTVAPPPGEELFRLATVSDLHFGRENFGYLGTMRDRSRDARPPSERCTTAAVQEAAAWGAQLLVAKGDISERGAVREWEAAARALRSVGLPVWAVPGNHDVGARRGGELEEVFDAHGIHTSRGLEVVDHPGVRLVMLDSTVSDWSVGRVHHQAEAVAEAVRDAPHGTLVCTHHHPMALPVPHFWPHGLPSVLVRRFMRTVVAAGSNVLFTSGHTHRNRRHRIRGVTWTEVGSVRDWPGVWAGYVVHEGGIRQVVRRVAEPSAIRWTTYTRGAVFGAWGVWAPGRISSRCFTQPWQR